MKVTVYLTQICASWHSRLELQLVSPMLSRANRKMPKRFYEVYGIMCEAGKRRARTRAGISEEDVSGPERLILLPGTLDKGDGDNCHTYSLLLATLGEALGLNPDQCRCVPYAGQESTVARNCGGDDGCLREERHISWESVRGNVGLDGDWSKVVVAGHSQGAGVAAYGATQTRLWGLIQICGPCDKDSSGNPPLWLKRDYLQVPMTRIASLSNINDTLCAHATANWKTEGLGDPKMIPLPTVVPSLSASSVVVTSMPSGEEMEKCAHPASIAAHNAPARCQSYKPLWVYLARKVIGGAPG